MFKKLNFYSKFSKVVSSIKIVLLLFGILLGLSGCEKITPPMLPEVSTPDTELLTVMTYNVYVGANMTQLLGITNLVEVPAMVAQVYDQLIASDFPGRAAGIAALIKAEHPHLIGLQEISLIRRQSPGDRLTGGEPAEEVVLDFLEILMDALQAEGLNYQVAAKVQNFDVEMPMSADGSFTDYEDIRLTDFDVILTRADVTVSRPTTINYTNIFSVEALFIEVQRGYAAIDATISGNTYRVVNTHLESFLQDIRVAQAQELIEDFDSETLPMIMLGDFNTSAPDSTAYQMLLSAGYTDLWQMGTGYTCCQEKTLQNETSQLYERIDQIFIRNLEFPASVMIDTVGDDPSERLASGLWPSDHAGVVAHLAFE